MITFVRTHALLPRGHSKRSAAHSSSSKDTILLEIGKRPNHISEVVSRQSQRCNQHRCPPRCEETLGTRLSFLSLLFSFVSPPEGKRRASNCTRTSMSPKQPLRPHTTREAAPQTARPSPPTQPPGRLGRGPQNRHNKRPHAQKRCSAN